MSEDPEGQDDPPTSGTEIRDEFRRFASVTAPVELDDPAKRRKWGLPPLDRPDDVGPYIIELNAQHRGGLPGAANTFLELYRQEITASAEHGQSRAVELPRRLAKSYYRCELTDAEWRRLVFQDERKISAERAIHRLWPDFPVKARTYRSAATIKADAAFRSFDAAGEDITWAVIDSGIQASHPHFGSAGARAAHVLLSDGVRDLHRCFADVPQQTDGDKWSKGSLDDPDAQDDMDPGARTALVEQHRVWALQDDFGHGTHVAGIIAGRAPADGTQVRVLERQYKINADGKKVQESFNEQTLRANAQLRGMAPLCKLISLRVLDHQGRGRSSQVIQALEYIRERLGSVSS